MMYRTAPHARIPATVETVPHPYQPGRWAALIHRSDDTPAPRFIPLDADTEPDAADRAARWLGCTLTAEETDPCTLPA